MKEKRFAADFFKQDVLTIAPALIGKTLVRRFPDGSISKFTITETEAYRGEEDLACHASKGRTNRTEIMYHEGGHIYVYLIYGMYWMLNFVTGEKDIPQAVLIRGLEGIYGPGRLTKHLHIDKSFYGENLCSSERLYVTEGMADARIAESTRIGIDYAGDIWKNKLWRFTLDKN